MSLVIPRDKRIAVRDLLIQHRRHQVLAIMVVAVARAALFVIPAAEPVKRNQEILVPVLLLPMHIAAAVFGWKMAC